MQLKLGMKCPLCSAEGGLKVYKFNEDHIKQNSEISGQCIKCPMEYQFIVKGLENMEKLRELVYQED
jgi:hypothetical protein